MNLASKINADLLYDLVGREHGIYGRTRQRTIMREFGAILPELLAGASITTPLRIAHFLAQVSHESDQFSTTVEYASGKAYEGRADLGNKEHGDGVRFKGRGPIQLTGRANYRNFSLWMKSKFSDAPDFLASPEMVGEFPWAGWAAIWFWITRNLNILADRDDLVAVTKAINGGRNGLADRARLLSAAKSIIIPLAGAILKEQNGHHVAHRGSSGFAVEKIQAALVNSGSPLGIDGEFGPATELAVKTFQKAHDLKPDGIVGPQTWLKLETIFKRGLKHGKAHL